MPNKMFLLLLTFLASFQGVYASDAGVVDTTNVSAPFALEIADADLGQITSFQTIQVDVPVRNLSGKRSLISRVVPRNLEDKVISFPSKELDPGGQSVIVVEVQTDGRPGRIARHFDVETSEPKSATETFAVRGFVDWIVVPESAIIELGSIERASRVERDIEISLRPGANLKLKDVLTGSNRFDATIGEGSSTLHLRGKANAPLGLFSETIVVSSDNPAQPKVGFTVRGQMLDRMIPSDNPVNFDLLRVGSGAQRIVRLERTDGEKLEIESALVSGVGASASIKDCIPRDDSCKFLVIDLAVQKVTGKLRGKVLVEYGTEPKDQLPIELGGIVIGKDTVVRDLAEDQKAAAEATPEVSSVLKSAVARPPSPMEMAIPDGAGPLLTWQVSNENGIYGYEIYRSESVAGPFNRANEKIVKRLDSTGKVGSIYRWRDPTAKSGSKYWYYVGLVFEDGRKREFTSPQAIEAK